jgi:hypothetical protein
MPPFFNYHIVRFVWRVFPIASGLQPPIDVDDLSLVWFQQIGQHMHSLICVGANAILWSIYWLCRKDVNFEKKKLHSYLHVILRAIYWTPFWNILQRGSEAMIWSFLTMSTRKLERITKQFLPCFLSHFLHCSSLHEVLNFQHKEKESLEHLGLVSQTLPHLDSISQYLNPFLCNTLVRFLVEN